MCCVSLYTVLYTTFLPFYFTLCHIPHSFLHSLFPFSFLVLPPLYLAYMVRAGGDSGKVHSTVRRRWEAGDHDVHVGMREFVRLADAARDALLQGKGHELAGLMDESFGNRRRIYSDEVVGRDNIEMVEFAKCVEGNYGMGKSRKRYCVVYSVVVCMVCMVYGMYDIWYGVWCLWV